MNKFIPFKKIFKDLKNNKVKNFNLYISDSLNSVKTYFDLYYQKIINKSLIAYDAKNNLDPNYLNLILIDEPEDDDITDYPNIIDAIERFTNFIINYKDFYDPINSYLELVEDSDSKTGSRAYELLSDSDSDSDSEDYKLLSLKNPSLYKAVDNLKNTVICYGKIGSKMIMVMLIGLRILNCTRNIKFYKDKCNIQLHYDDMTVLKFNLEGEISGLLENKLSASITNKPNFINYMVMFNYIDPKIVIRSSIYSYTIYEEWETFQSHAAYYANRFEEKKIKFIDLDGKEQVVDTYTLRQMLSRMFHKDSNLKILMITNNETEEYEIPVKFLGTVQENAL